MITKKYIKDLDFKTIDQVFDYVLESEINGQRQQAKRIIGDMSHRQRNQFAVYLENDCPYHHSHIDKVKEVLFSDSVISRGLKNKVNSKI